MGCLLGCVWAVWCSVRCWLSSRLGRRMVCSGLGNWLGDVGPQKRMNGRGEKIVGGSGGGRTYLIRKNGFHEMNMAINEDFVGVQVETFVASVVRGIPEKNTGL